MQEFTFSGTAMIQSINLRAENHGEEKVPALDVKLQIKGSDELCAHFDPVLHSLFFNEHGNVRNKALHGMRVDGELQPYEIKFGRINLDGFTLDKFYLSPEDGRRLLITLSARRTVDGEEASKLHPMLQQEISVQLSPQQASLV